MSDSPMLVRIYQSPGSVSKERSFDSYMDASKHFAAAKFSCKSPTAIIELVVNGAVKQTHDAAGVMTPKKGKSRTKKSKISPSTSEAAKTKKMTDKKRKASDVLDNKEAKKSSKQTKPKKEKDPNAPKRPPSSYMCFSNVRRPQIIKENAGIKLTMPELSKFCGAEWKELTEEEKKPYIEMAQKAKERHAKVMAAYQEKKAKEEAMEVDADEADAEDDTESASSKNEDLEGETEFEFDTPPADKAEEDAMQKVKDAEDDPASPAEEDKTAVEETTEEAAVEETAKEAAVEESMEEAAVEKSTEEATVDDSTEGAAVEETTEDAAVDKSTEEAAVEESSEEAAVKETTQEAVIEETMQEAAVEETMQKAAVTEAAVEETKKVAEAEETEEKAGTAAVDKAWVQEWLSKAEKVEALQGIFGDEWRSMLEDLPSKDNEELRSAVESMEESSMAQEDGSEMKVALQFMISCTKACLEHTNTKGAKRKAEVDAKPQKKAKKAKSPKSKKSAEEVAEEKAKKAAVMAEEKAKKAAEKEKLAAERAAKKTKAAEEKAEKAAKREAEKKERAEKKAKEQAAKAALKEQKEKEKAEKKAKEEAEKKEKAEKKAKEQAERKALKEVERLAKLAEKEKNKFILPEGWTASTETKTNKEGKEVKVTSYKSPLGKVLMSKKAVLEWDVEKERVQAQVLSKQRSFMAGFLSMKPKEPKEMKETKKPKETKKSKETKASAEKAKKTTKKMEKKIKVPEVVEVEEVTPETDTAVEAQQEAGQEDASAPPKVVRTSRQKRTAALNAETKTKQDLTDAEDDDADDDEEFESKGGEEEDDEVEDEEAKAEAEAEGVELAVEVDMEEDELEELKYDAKKERFGTPKREAAHRAEEVTRQDLTDIEDDADDEKDEDFDAEEDSKEDGEEEDVEMEEVGEAELEELEGEEDEEQLQKIKQDLAKIPPVAVEEQTAEAEETAKTDAAEESADGPGESPSTKEDGTGEQKSVTDADFLAEWVAKGEEHTSLSSIFEDWKEQFEEINAMTEKEELEAGKQGMQQAVLDVEGEDMKAAFTFLIEFTQQRMARLA